MADRDPVVVVGSGPSGLHFAQTLLEHGRQVMLLDVGHEPTPAVHPEQDWWGLRRQLEDPVEYFVGRAFESLLLPVDNSEYYGFPPGKRYVFEGTSAHRSRAVGFAPLASFATGGLAQAWTGGCYPFTAAELEAFPFGDDELAPYYQKIAQRIGITSPSDDLEGLFPFAGGQTEPLELDEHSERLLRRYEKHRAAIQRKLHCRMGRARLAVLTSPKDGREACTKLGRCLWGCPTGALYTPHLTLKDCLKNDRFEYRRGIYVKHFFDTAEGHIDRVVVSRLEDGSEEEIRVGSLVLAAGTLGSSKIYLDSLERSRGERVELSGLMDNRQVILPFVNYGLLGSRFEPRSYQYHTLAIALTEDSRQPSHGLITTLKTAMIHPIVQSVPTSMRTALRVFRNLHGALGLVNWNLADERREDNRVFLEQGRDGSRLVVHYQPDREEPATLTRQTKTVRRLLRKLGCIAPRAMEHRRPMGASVHYAGTIPMTESRAPQTTDANGKSCDFSNLWFVDGTTFPSLPAKNLTFTLMANAARIAEREFC